MLFVFTAPLFLSGINCVDFFSVFLFVISFALQNSERALTSFSFSLPDPGEDECIWFDDVCALCPFPLCLSLFSASLPLPSFWLPQILPLESDSWLLPLSEAGSVGSSHSSNSVGNINAQYKADTPGPGVVSAAFPFLSVSGVYMVYFLI